MNIEVGKIISQEVSDLLRDFSTKENRANVSINSNISASTLREITYRNQAVSEYSLPAVKSLLKIARENAVESEKKSRQSAKELLTILDTI